MDPELFNNVNQSIEKAQNATTEHICKRCGFDQSLEYSPVSEELLKTYFKTMLTQSPFSHTSKLFDGLLTVTFEEPTGKLLKLQELASIHRTKTDESTISDALDFSMLPALSLVTTTSEESGTKVVYKADKERRIKLLESFTVPDELAEMPLTMLQALRNTYAEFAKLCARLVTEAQDKNFWKGVGRN